jgi:hypothetical protein
VGVLAENKKLLCKGFRIKKGVFLKNNFQYWFELNYYSKSEGLFSDFLLSFLKNWIQFKIQTNTLKKVSNTRIDITLWIETNALKKIPNTRIDLTIWIQFNSYGSKQHDRVMVYILYLNTKTLFDFNKKERIKLPTSSC